MNDLTLGIDYHNQWGEEETFAPTTFSHGSIS